MNLQGGGVVIFAQRERVCDERESVLGVAKFGRGVVDFGEGAMATDQWRAAWGLKMEGLQAGNGRGVNWLDLEHVDPHQPTQFKSLGDEQLQSQSNSNSQPIELDGYQENTVRSE